MNIAARLEQLAEPGSICISGSVHDHAEGKVAALFESQGEQRLKNIARPVTAYRMVLDGAAPSAALATSLQSDKPAVAVLPFANMSGGPEQTYFSDGITEDVITELSRFRELVVIAPDSSFAFRGQSTNLARLPGR